jgi:hypothetical protein
MRICRPPEAHAFIVDRKTAVCMLGKATIRKIVGHRRDARMISSLDGLPIPDCATKERCP